MFQSWNAVKDPNSLYQNPNPSPLQKKPASRNPIKGSWRRAKWINWSEAKWFSIRRTISQINGWTVARTSLTHRSKSHHQREKGPKMTLECGATPHVEELQIGRRHDGRQWLYERWGGTLYDMTCGVNLGDARRVNNQVGRGIWHIIQRDWVVVEDMLECSVEPKCRPSQTSACWVWSSRGDNLTD